MTTKKCLIIAAGSVALLVSSCCAFKYFTGDCPLMCIKRHLKGETKAPASN